MKQKMRYYSRCCTNSPPSMSYSKRDVVFYTSTRSSRGDTHPSSFHHRVSRCRRWRRKYPRQADTRRAIDARRKIADIHDRSRQTRVEPLRSQPRRRETRLIGSRVIIRTFVSARGCSNV